MNDTLRSKGLVLSALVFGEFLQIRASDSDDLQGPDAVECVKFAEYAYSEMASQPAKLCLIELYHIRFQTAFWLFTNLATKLSFGERNQLQTELESR